MGTDCNTVDEHAPAEQNSSGRGLDSLWLVGSFVFSFYPSVVYP